MIHLVDNPFCVVIPNDPLAAQNVIDLAQLANEQWIDRLPALSTTRVTTSYSKHVPP